MPFHFGESICKSIADIEAMESVGIFMPTEQMKDKIADVTILSNMIVETEINGQKALACNWKEWMSEHAGCSADNIYAFAEAEAGNTKSPYSARWKSLLEYSARL